jgi:hypothetical protein
MDSGLTTALYLGVVQTKRSSTTVPPSSDSSFVSTSKERNIDKSIA